MYANMVTNTSKNPNIKLFMLQEILAAPLGGGGGGETVVEGVVGGVPLGAVLAATTLTDSFMPPEQ
jgi:hypothetical protein